MSNSRIYLGMPSYGKQTNRAGQSFWRACRDMSNVINNVQPGSLLAENFNVLWCDALNRAHWGEKIDYFAMIHDDIGAGEYWLDNLIEELEVNQLDILGVAVAIKDGKGLTSLALDHESSLDSEDFDEWLAACGIRNPSLEAIAELSAAFAALHQRRYDWRPFCRLTMRDVHQLPETFTSDDVKRPLLLNSGLWVCKFNLEWARQVHFEINDRIAFDVKEDRYHAQVEPEDWFFSRQCHELGLKIGATRKLLAVHRGECDFGNARPWGRHAFDSEYTNISPIPEPFPYDVQGWLFVEEGQALRELCRGKRVLEIGSYAGKSSICIAQSAISLVCMDYFDGRATAHPQDTLPAFALNTQRYGVDKKISICHPDEPIPLPEYDVVFVDGAHDFASVTRDIEKALSVLKPNGLLAFHDYRKHPGEVDGAWDPEVPAAINKYCDESGAEIISRHGTLAVVRPPAEIPLEV